MIGSIVADREFVGDSWLDLLNGNGIKCYIRNSFKVALPHKDKTIKAWHLLNAYRVNEFIYCPKVVRINGQPCYLPGCKLPPKRGRPDLLIIVSFNAPDMALGPLQGTMADRDGPQGREAQWL